VYFGFYSICIESFSITGELYVLTELCRSSLLAYLRKCEFKQSGQAQQPEDITLEHMTCWSAEIAKGMEFISSQRIVHGDLAARNVLLSFDLKCKISDFGLARQLVNYQYITFEQVRLVVLYIVRIY
jgi:serine/threonine protein kinase